MTVDNVDGSWESVLAGLVERMEEATEGLCAAARVVDVAGVREQAQVLEGLAMTYTGQLDGSTAVLGDATRPLAEQLTVLARMSFLYARELGRTAGRQLADG